MISGSPIQDPQRAIINKAQILRSRMLNRDVVNATSFTKEEMSNNFQSEFENTMALLLHDSESLNSS